MNNHEFKPGYIDGTTQLFVACEECGKPVTDDIHQTDFEATNRVHVYKHDTELDKINEALAEHDCHAGPESGCLACMELRNGAESWLSRVKKKLNQ